MITSAHEMKIKHVSVTLAAAALALLFCAPAVVAEDAPAFRSDDFVDMIGLNASPFHTYVADGRWKGAGTKYPPEFLYDLGVRAFRTAFQNELAMTNETQLLQEWWRKTGARPMLMASPVRSRTVKTDWLKVPEDGDFTYFLNGLKEFDPRAIDALSGPNEVNNKFPPQELNLKYRGLIDEAAGAKWQQDMFAAVRADPATKRIPIINYDAIFTAYLLAEPNAAFDYLNIHPYQGSDVPSSSLPRSMVRTANILPKGAVVPPFDATECGYNVELDVSNHQGYTGTLRAQAFNNPMLFAEYFRHGIHRAYLFALHNADGYGLLESDQETKRPSWHAVKSLIDILKDSEWDSERLEWRGGKTFAPRALRFEMEGGAADASATVRTLTLQKENGDWNLLVWNERPNYDKAKGDIMNPLVPIRLKFAPEMGALETVALYAQSEISEADLATPEGRMAGAFKPVASPPQVKDGAVALSVPSRLLILQLRARDSATKRKAPPAPTIFSGAADGNSVRLAVTAPQGASSVLLFRNGMHIGTLHAANRTGAQLEYTDSSYVISPGLGYRYEAQTVAPDGSLSERAEIVVTTAAKYPDLVIGDFGIEAAQASAKIKEGDVVKFAGALKNQGDGATPNPAPAASGMWDSSLTITFRVDGKVVGWGGDRGQTPLAPGATRDVEITGGPNSVKGWVATAGTHVLQAEADDIWRIGTERRRDNNLATKTITVGEYAGLLAMESRPAPGGVDLEKTAPLDWVIFGEWNGNGKTIRKENANLIGAVAQSGSGHIGVNPGCAVHIKQADGNIGLWGNGVGNGYEFEAPAGKEERVLKVYVSASGGGHGEFSAELSDGSAPAFADSAWNGDLSRKWAAAPGEFSAVYTLRYRAASDGQKLKIRWRLADEPDRFRAQIRIQAAVLYN